MAEQPQQQERQRWLPLEGTPEVLGPYLLALGGPQKSGGGEQQAVGKGAPLLQFEDLLAVEPWAFDMLDAKDTEALLLLFPITASDEEEKKYVPLPEDQEQHDEDLRKSIWFVKQVCLLLVIGSPFKSTCIYLYVYGILNPAHTCVSPYIPILIYTYRSIRWYLSLPPLSLSVHTYYIILYVLYLLEYICLFFLSSSAATRVSMFATSFLSECIVCLCLFYLSAFPVSHYSSLLLLPSVSSFALGCPLPLLQTVPNACGTVAVLHCTANLPRDKYPLHPDGFLESFFSKLNPKF